MGLKKYSVKMEQKSPGTFCAVGKMARGKEQRENGLLLRVIVDDGVSVGKAESWRGWGRGGSSSELSEGGVNIYTEGPPDIPTGRVAPQKNKPTSIRAKLWR